MFNSNKFINISIFVLLLSLGGLPPFLGFIPKWIIIELLIKRNNFVILVFILFITLITLYFYLRLTYSALLLNHVHINWNFKFDLNVKKLNQLIIINFISLIGLLIINFIYILI